MIHVNGRHVPPHPARAGLVMMDRWLGAFADWFGSRAGILQTTVVTLAWTFAAVVWQSLDPDLFRTMAILTIYSAVTQPVLAFCARRAADKADTDTARLTLTEQHVEQITQAIFDRIPEQRIIETPPIGDDHRS